jgi:hypothetical protein
MSKNQRSRKQHQPAITVDQFLEHLAGRPSMATAAAMRH